jgi:hypothetical protein
MQGFFNNKKLRKGLKKKNKIKEKVFQKFERALSATIAAKFIQIENQINLLYDLQIASVLPLIK